jgi:hypothetical protein
MVQPPNNPPPPINLGAISEPVLPIQTDRRAEEEKRANFSDLTRKERVKNVLNWVFIVFIIVASTIAVTVIAIRLVHLILPESNQWLTNEQIQGIDKLFFSGAIGGFIATYFKKSSE